MPHDGLFWFPLHDDIRILAEWPRGLARAFLYRGVYEPQTIAWMRENIRPDWLCVDVGANIGYMTVMMAKYAAYVIALEPDPRLHEILQMNLSANNIDNTEVWPVAASDSEGNARFFVNREPLFSGLVGHNGLTDIIEVETVTLDNTIWRADLIKIDVEGAENMVLKGMQRHMNENEGLKIIVEVEPDRPGFSPEVYDLLEGWNFKNLDGRNLLCWRNEND
jgi:FkbM family methyltransferase